ncbi:LysR family transcriptional regulator [Pelagibacterium lacus]|uniref:LysR family transcriptional regulator n=1 Tax=Pelagibacterium lacus TaxID=2282655 RepID=A0A369W6I7_9HYPH|nr:LysR family transcriptional regulator [Pelagibacterium lacus]RDE08872.1 LysR family transcriptional regulator [Pelagibacterium lacus]
MAIPRRFLPSMSLLTAFEAAARHESFTMAAEELSISQSAVSRQIRLLEEQIGSQLFVREKQTVRLSEAGAAYAREIREALNRVANASLNLRANPHGGTFNLAILPTFGTRWLAPRLSRFLDRHPGITINLSTRLSAFDFRTDPFDAAIHFGDKPWAGTEGVELMAETVVPVASPAFLERHRIESAADMVQLPLLHLASRPDQWERWFAAQHVEVGRLRGMLFDQFATAAQAAGSGLGLALLPAFLIEGDLKRGDLVAVLDAPMLSEQRYFLIWPMGQGAQGPLKLFRDWIVSEMG